MRRSEARQSGETLVEALVAMMVLAVGFLGLAAMQLKSLQSADAAVQRGLADLAAQDARERLWAALASDSGHACPDAAAVNASDWHGSWGPWLPGLHGDPVTALPDCGFVIEVSWLEARFGGEASAFDYRLRLPATPR